MAENEVKKPGFFERVKNFFKNIKGEIGKIKWAEPKDTLHRFYIVLVVVAIMAIAIWGLDWLFNSLFTRLLPTIF